MIRSTISKLLLDVPLALLVALLSFGSAQSAAYWQNRPPMGPPWEQPGRGAPFDPGAPPPSFGEPYGVTLMLWVSIIALGVAVRRIRPIVGYALTVIGTCGYLAAGLPLGPVLVAPALGLLAMANRMPVRSWAPWAVLLAPMVWAGFVSEDYLGFSDPGLPSALILGGAAMITPALIAGLRRSRRDAERRTHELDVRRAAYQERLKIARDVHDLVGHSLSVINMQAGVALYLLDKAEPRTEHRTERRTEHETERRTEDAATRPDDGGRAVTRDTDRQLHESLQAIRSTSKSALDELRATLAVFRGEDGEQRAPVAGLERLPELVEAFRTAGRTVELRVVDQDELIKDLPSGIDTAAYRIVQEALTNVARHTRDASATVTVRADARKLIIDVTDDGPSVQPRQHDGSGLIGMAERAESVGGTVHSGPLPERGFGIHAEFPIPARSMT